MISTHADVYHQSCFGRTDGDLAHVHADVWVDDAEALVHIVTEHGHAVMVPALARKVHEALDAAIKHAEIARAGKRLRRAD